MQQFHKLIYAQVQIADDCPQSSGWNWIVIRNHSSPSCIFRVTDKDMAARLPQNNKSPLVVTLANIPAPILTEVWSHGNHFQINISRNFLAILSQISLYQRDGILNILHRFFGSASVRMASGQTRNFSDKGFALRVFVNNHVSHPS